MYMYVILVQHSNHPINVKEDIYYIGLYIYVFIYNTGLKSLD